MANAHRKPISSSTVTPLHPELAKTKTDAGGLRRSFGRIDRLPSGMWRARYIDPENPRRRLAADTTFQTKTDAAAWLARKQAEIIEHRWKPAAPDERPTVTFADYATHWMQERDLSPKTRTEYDRQLQGRLRYFDAYSLDEITPGIVKRWFDTQDVRYPTARKRAYEVLHSILATASRPDEDTDAPPLIDVNPARLTAKTLNRSAPGSIASNRHARIKPATLSELASIMDAVPGRYRAIGRCQPCWVS